MRISLIAIVGAFWYQLQAIPEAEAIANASTSSGDPCDEACIDGYYDCAGDWVASYLNGSGPGNCIGYYDYCGAHCDVYGSPFTSWWLF